MTEAEFGIVANVLSDRVLRTGAKVWIVRCNGDTECPRVCGLNKGGRWVEKYTHYKRLTNFRSVWVPEHLRNRVAWMFTKSEAAERAAQLADIWSDVRFYNRDGSEMLKAGVSISVALERVRAERETRQKAAP